MFRRQISRRYAGLRRRGLTLAELLVAAAVMSLVAVALGALASAVEKSESYTRGHGSALQYARVALQRIEHHVATATATPDFPGFVVLVEQVNTWQFPDTLVVWHPDGAPTNADGPPLFSELVIFCPDPSEPKRLLEITVPGDARSTPPLSNASAWQTEILAIKNSSSSHKVVLLETLYTALAATAENSRRGAVRFAGRYLPSRADWTAYESGTIAWDALPWVQGIYGTETGLRQSWCNIELQLAPQEPGPNTSDGVIPAFGSAALYYNLPR